MKQSVFFNLQIVFNVWISLCSLLWSWFLCTLNRSPAEVMHMWSFWLVSQISRVLLYIIYSSRSYWVAETRPGFSLQLILILSLIISSWGMWSICANVVGFPAKAHCSAAPLTSDISVLRCGKHLLFSFVRHPVYVQDWADKREMWPVSDTVGWGDSSLHTTYFSYLAPCEGIRGYICFKWPRENISSSEECRSTGALG